MMILAYIDIRPFLYIGGLPVFVGLALFVYWLAKKKFKTRNVILFSALLFTALFTIFLTGIGPFVDRKQTREFLMTWEIRPGPSNGMKETEVVLRFVDYPNEHIGEYSDELAAYLRDKGEPTVKVVFEVTSDYGKVRGFHAMEIAGLRQWKSEWGYAGSAGDSGESPWD